MDVQIEFPEKQEIERKQGNGESEDGRKYSWDFTIQTCYLHNGDLYPQKMETRLPKDSPPYAAGRYTILPSSYEVYKGQIQFKRELDLAPVASSGRRASA